jgi:hypothetical protein
MLPFMKRPPRVNSLRVERGCSVLVLVNQSTLQSPSSEVMLPSGAREVRSAFYSRSRSGEGELAGA